MKYPISCACGNTHQVSGGDAGTTLNCTCGRTVDIPALHVLRLQSGQAAISPELMIESLLKERRLPEEAHCVGCSVTTEDVCQVDVVCERKEVKRDRSVSHFTFLSPFLGFFGWMVSVFVGEPAPDQVLGRDVRFRLPLRFCHICSANLVRSNVGEMLCRVSVYRQLLTKYPHSEIAIVKR